MAFSQRSSLNSSEKFRKLKKTTTMHHCIWQVSFVPQLLTNFESTLIQLFFQHDFNKFYVLSLSITQMAVKNFCEGGKSTTSE